MVEDFEDYPIVIGKHVLPSDTASPAYGLYESILQSDSCPPKLREEAIICIIVALVDKKECDVLRDISASI